MSPEVYDLELKRIWRPAWLFAAHAAELRRPGERTVFDVGDDSVLIVRGENEEVRAFHNLCRHRGTRLYEPSEVDGRPGAGTSAGNLVRCPYHQWAYRLDGSLAACGGMESSEGLDKATYGLLPVECAELGGLIFVRLEAPPGPGQGRGPAEVHQLGAALSPQGLSRAKVAYRQSYVVGAGWKILWENNRECWHCHLGHPEYIKSHFDTFDTGSRHVQGQARRRTEEMLTALGNLPAGDVFDGAGLSLFPSPGHSWSAHRTPLVDGFATESLDGPPVAPLMGDYQSYDVGVLRVRGLPNFWCHASADHAVTTRLVPVGVERTAVVVTWLVDEDAIEGRDYVLERLLPVWRRTSEQDWALCERNQRGVRSPAYVPGPLSGRREANVTAFHQWYREMLL
jgi:Rieske 2Fe-2S family protein